MTFSGAKVRIFNDNDDDDDDFFLRKHENTMIFRQKNIRNRRILTITMTITITFFLTEHEVTKIYRPRMSTNETLMIILPRKSRANESRIKLA